MKIMLPDTNQLLRYDGQGSILVRLDNRIGDEVGSRIWCAEWVGGRRVDVPIERLQVIADREAPSDDAIEQRVLRWAVNGDPDAAWWLSHLDGGVSGASSSWFGLAAIRRCPLRYRWLLPTVIRDARYGLGLGVMDCSYLHTWPEIHASQRCDDWSGAIANALATRHSPLQAAPEQIDLALAYVRELPREAPAWSRSTKDGVSSVFWRRGDAHLAAFLAGVTYDGFVRLPEYVQRETAVAVLEAT